MADMAANYLWMCLSVIMLTISACTASLTPNDYGTVTNRMCYHMEKRKLSISHTHPMLYRDLGSFSEHPGANVFSCEWEVEGKELGLGVVAVIQRMRLRSEGQCIDHISFRESRAWDSGEHICGSMVFGIPANQDLYFLSPTTSPLLPPTPPTTPSPPPSNKSVLKHNPWRVHAMQGAVIDPLGELTTYVHVAKRPLDGEEPLLLAVAYTAFEVCDGSSKSSSLFHCGYGLCISSELVNDGVVNCPFGNCIDEGNCSLAKESEFAVQIFNRATSPYDPYLEDVGPSIVTIIGIIFIVVISFGLLLACAYYLRRRKDRQRSQEP
ncbi:uncharacterized protein LOC124157998 [Ischnura elegans]|uniref:uncharacterized protein LOC124157998 n=1 Tax=Ischnura elegans TaxID=197161 RepID=UPI001ED89C75|nr:uncharacterized protein LOC124157998 [Ischnura elegans]XP_046389092.1 uncharacterized protein LOC124157998 [Ischnura elegans]